jgi:hypothetical protein
VPDEEVLYECHESCKNKKVLCATRISRLCVSCKNKKVLCATRISKFCACRLCVSCKNKQVPCAR